MVSSFGVSAGLCLKQRCLDFLITRMTKGFGWRTRKSKRKGRDQGVAGLHSKASNCEPPGFTGCGLQVAALKELDCHSARLPIELVGFARIQPGAGKLQKHFLFPWKSIGPQGS